MAGLSDLPKLKGKRRKAKRKGIGLGSGKGKTAGRGHKGQKARGKVKLGFEGGQLKLIKRLPFVRGTGFRRVAREKPVVINLSKLARLSAGTVVSLDLLKEKGLVPVKTPRGVKILGQGEIKQSLIIQGLQVSIGAKKKIEEAGGKVK